MEPRHNEPAHPSPATSAAPTDHASSKTGGSRRTIGAVIGVALLVGGGIVATGALAGPVDDLLAGPGTSTANEGIPNEAFTPPVNSTALREAHRAKLNASGSFTVVEEYRVESTSADDPLRDETRTASFDLHSGQTLLRISTSDFQVTAYNTGTEKYERIQRSSEDPQYRISDRQISPEPYLDSNILTELATMDVKHRKTEDGHTYTASGVDAVSNDFLNADVDSFRSFEFNAVVSNQGVLREFSYQVEVEDSGEIITVTRSVNVTDLGTTEVREPTWLDEAREATN